MMVAVVRRMKGWDEVLTCVTPPREPVRPKILTTFARRPSVFSPLSSLKSTLFSSADYTSLTKEPINKKAKIDKVYVII
jgi:hypothetical protein